MAPPREQATRVPLFCTSRTPFPSAWIDKLCKDALDTPYEVPDDAEIVLIEGDFVNWTPLQIARRYVIPHLTREDSPFASLILRSPTMSHTRMARS